MDQPNKKYPWSTPQVAKMLGMDQEESRLPSDRNAVQVPIANPVRETEKKQDSIYHSFKDVAIFILVVAIAGAGYFYYSSSQKGKTETSGEDITRQEVENNQIAASAALQANHDVTPSFGKPASPGIQNDSVDTNVPGILEIPSINITVPLIWTKDTKDFDADLKMGVVHYPGTALPGELGTSYISGHSSGYAWDNNPYKKTFSKLGDVPDYASFSLTLTLTDGTKIKQHYVVTKRGIYKPDDQEQFKNTAEPLVALSTCWPVGTTKDRLVLFGKLASTEKL
ncbi:MAG: sortase [Patescibacteria group bacterium]